MLNKNRQAKNNSVHNGQRVVDVVVLKGEENANRYWGPISIWI